MASVDFSSACLAEICHDSESDEEFFYGCMAADVNEESDYDSCDEIVVNRDDLTDAYDYPWLKIFEEKPGPKFDLADDDTEIDVFCKLIDDDFLDMLVTETNRYAHQFITNHPNLKPNALARSWVEVTQAEIKAYIGILLYMGAVKMPNYHSYWSTNPLLEVKGFRDIMSRDRWQQINMFLHLSDNNSRNLTRDDPNYDRIGKVRPVIAHLLRNFQALYTVDRDVSVDESIIAFKERTGMRQYMPQKPDKWGIKAWTLSDSRTGYCYNWAIYTGSKGLTETGLTQRVVTEMCTPLYGKGHHVYMDDYFTSLDLYEELANNETGACGTMRTDRRGTPDVIKTAKMKKGDPPIFHRDGKFLFVAWQDKKQVTVLTSVHNDKVTIKTVLCKDTGTKKRDIEKPMAIEEYDRSMGDVDLMDQKIWPYLTVHRTVKWWKKVFFYLLELTFENFTILWQELNPGQRIDKIKLRMTIIHHLVADYDRPTRPYSRNASNDLPSRLTQSSHFIGIHTGKTKAKRQAYPDCVVCSERVRGGRHQTQYKCKQCDKPMCPYPCFERYHTLQDYKIKCSKSLHQPHTIDNTNIEEQD